MPPIPGGIMPAPPGGIIPLGGIMLPGGMPCIPCKSVGNLW